MESQVSSQEHVCCHCPEHAADCTYHDIVFHEQGCQLRLASDLFVANVVVEESRGNRLSPQSLSIDYIVDRAICLDQISAVISSLLPCLTDHFVISEWASVSLSQKAPPVLI